MDKSLIEPGKKYLFRLADVICPDRQDVVMKVTTELEVAGEVMFLSDGGHDPERFAVVGVEGIETPLIIPVECLRPTGGIERVSAQVREVPLV